MGGRRPDMNEYPVHDVVSLTNPREDCQVMPRFIAPPAGNVIYALGHGQLLLHKNMWQGNLSH
jgi:hypothetical protein